MTPRTTSTSIVVWERGRHWYRRLRKRLPAARLTSVTLRESLEEHLVEWPGSSIVVDVPRDELAGRLEAVVVCPAEIVAVVLPRGLERERHWFYRAGAAWVQTSLRVDPAMVRLLQRTGPAAAKKRPASWRDEWLERLPWKQHALSQERSQRE